MTARAQRRGIRKKRSLIKRVMISLLLAGVFIGATVIAGAVLR